MDPFTEHPFKSLVGDLICAICGGPRTLHHASVTDLDRERRIRAMVAARMDRPANPLRVPEPGVLDPDKCPSAGT